MIPTASTETFALRVAAALRSGIDVHQRVRALDQTGVVRAVSQAAAIAAEACYQTPSQSVMLTSPGIAATFRAFQWSGANSVFHRARAADELSSLLASDPDHANSIVISGVRVGRADTTDVQTRGSSSTPGGQ